jgi:hypothetical protein
MAKYNKPVEVVEKLPSMCFESFGKAHEHRERCVFFLATPIDSIR